MFLILSVLPAEALIWLFVSITFAWCLPPQLLEFISLEVEDFWLLEVAGLDAPPPSCFDKFWEACWVEIGLLAPALWNWGSRGSFGRASSEEPFVFGFWRPDEVSWRWCPAVPPCFAWPINSAWFRYAALARFWPPAACPPVNIDADCSVNIIDSALVRSLKFCFFMLKVSASFFAAAFYMFI